MTPIEQHNIEIAENADSWRRKPLLRELYSRFYRRLASHLPTGVEGPVVELGSGMGQSREWLPGVITTDLFANQGIDQVENGYALSFGNETLSAIVAFDVWHHLRYPGTALAEWRRVLRPGGRVLLFEPDLGALGRFIYGRFHHEPLALAEPIAWEAPPGWDAAKQDYYAAQGNGWRLFVQRERGMVWEGFRLHTVERFAAFSYVASGGLRGPQLYPRFLLPLLRLVDRVLGWFPRLFSTRLLVVLEKNG